jgi:hypothetical protein
MVVFAYDNRDGLPDEFEPKVMIRCLLFSTAERGHAVELLFLKLRHGGGEWVFPVWGVAAPALERGGGLFVPKSGVTAWHHFVSSGISSDFRFKPGLYEIEILARFSGAARPKKLRTETLALRDQVDPRSGNKTAQAWFDRDPESGELKGRVASPGGANEEPAN